MSTTASTLTPQQTPAEPGSSTRLRLLIAIGAATVLLLFWTLFVRASNAVSGLTLESFEQLGFNQYFWGFAAQELFVPLVLLFVFSRTALFRRVVTRPDVSDIPPADLAWLIAVLAGIQLLFFGYEYWLIVTEEQQVTLGLLMVLVAGLLGGWRAGLAIGLVTSVALGLVDYLGWSDEPFQFAVYVEYYVLKFLPAATAVWLGVVAGCSAQLLRERRFRPIVVFGTAVVAELLAFGFYFLSTDYAGFLVERLLPNVVTSGLAALAFAMMVRIVLEEQSQLDAEAAQLALAQTQLKLTEANLALAEAELRALHAQINPHFFFNSLNTIRYFIRTEPDTARDLLLRLSEIFQQALSAGEFVPLRDELQHVEAYLVLEKARLEEKLQIVWTNLARTYLDTAVPTLVLQPIVENAVIHGIATQPGGGTLHIVINHVGDDLLFQVDDDGAGFDTAGFEAYLRGDLTALAGRQAVVDNGRVSIGLRNVDERLRMLYGDAYGLHVESTPGHGTRVVFKVPLAA